MSYQIPDEIQKIITTFSDADFQIYIVGGAVRDLFLDKAVADWDLTTDAKPEEIQKLFPDSFYTNKFGTVGIPANSGMVEITTMRQEGEYQDHRHPTDVSWTKKLDEDLARRDFTINAMALSDDGKLTDLFAGLSDLKKKIIRAVGEPDKRFKEDALRMLKAFRMISQLDFKLDQNTFESILKNKDLIKSVAYERIREELFKLLIGVNPYIGLLKMREAGILEIILPEVEACFKVIQEGPKHDRVYDVGEHLLESVRHTPSNDPITKLAALLHDIGKVDTRRVQDDGNVTFYHHEVVGEAQSREIAKRFNLSNEQKDKLLKLVRFHLFTVDENQTDSAVRRFIKNIGIENIDDMMALRVGDRLGGGTKTPTSWRTEKFKDRIKQVLTKPFSISDLKVNGADVMKELDIKPGPKVGEVLNKLFEEVLEDSSRNNRDYLITRAKELV